MSVVATMEKEKPTTSAFAKKIEPFVCGGSAATFASVVIHPIDLAKVRRK
jgi:solute carrier family 25 oxoglutarate transporter 11